MDWLLVGTGKTYMTELFFGKLLGLPVINLDMTGFQQPDIWAVSSIRYHKNY
jgi:hypothetical protein